jgi:hypothetical protein
MVSKQVAKLGDDKAPEAADLCPSHDLVSAHSCDTSGNRLRRKSVSLQKIIQSICCLLCEPICGHWHAVGMNVENPRCLSGRGLLVGSKLTGHGGTLCRLTCTCWVLLHQYLRRIGTGCFSTLRLVRNVEARTVELEQFGYA